MKNSKYACNLQDILLILSMLSLGMGNYNNLLPLNVSQIFILFLSFVTILRSLKRNLLYVPRFFIYSFGYIFCITFIININGIESIKALGILSIYFITLYNYVKQTKDNEKIIKILYDISFVFSLIGIVQQIGFVIKIEPLYNFSYLGIHNGISVSGNLMRVTSLFTEPAHFATIVIPGASIAIIEYLNVYKFKFSNKYKNICFFLASLFTFSLVVYLTIGLIILYKLIFVSQNIKNKIKFAIYIGVIAIIGVIFADESLLIISQKYESLFNLNKGLTGSNLSGFAVISNIKIAIAKLKDGYFFGTGLESHERTYFKYIGNIYSNVVMYLNYTDAASLYTRIMSEMGIFGLIAYIVFIFKSVYITIRMKVNKKSMVISSVCVVTVIGFGLRMGVYTNSIFILALCTLITQNKILIKNNDSSPRMVVD